ncbi:hypothetical protein QBC46DRAFT_324902 [Diplogelasinospora grovesii]|uniref:Uncharacterized protein n=1 Tax=Diplogelasinospora grovesii TaxID=303347 RepID=A0AAN6RZU7_9PEZI|nr:hypothetical protein QBC46DRAFT_324902 [Diplogelasinospora grovesii]
MAASKMRSGSWYVQQYGNGEAGLHFNNSGDGPLLVPGFGLPVDVECTPMERFAHGAHDWAQPRLTAREIAMLRLMDRLTEVPDWHVKVLEKDDSETIAAMRQEALAGHIAGPLKTYAHLISPAAWEWCLAELRDKAVFFRETGLISVCDSASCVITSDSLILRDILAKLQVPNPNSGDEIVDLIDPKMFPLVYGRTRVLSEGGALNLSNALASVGQGQIAPNPAHEPISRDEINGRLFHLQNGDLWEHWSQSKPYRHTSHSQWLPCEVSFTGEQGSTGVRITSYINNLHPVRYRSLHRTIKEVISLSIKPWNEVLVRRDRPRKPPRIRCYGVPWVPPYPEWAYELGAIERDRTSEEYREAKKLVEQFLAIPDPRTKKPGLHGHTNSSLEGRGTLERAMKMKHKRFRVGWAHPEPGQAFSYTDWKAGKAGRAVIPKLSTTRGTYGRVVLSQPDHQFYTVSLQDTFREQGLQVVVKLTTVELTPDNSSFSGTDWHIDGLLNEHIVATTILCLFSTNTTPAALSFRVEADLEPNEHTYEPREGSELATVLDLPSARALGADGNGGAPALQDLGAVALSEGRLVAVPNVLQRRMEPFSLENTASPGHKRFLILYLVDPHYRVCSTRNVPPQQHAWWWDAAEGDQVVAGWGKRGVPQEVANSICNEIGEWPMGWEEAARIREARAREEMVGTAAVQVGVQTYCFDWD